MLQASPWCAGDGVSGEAFRSGQTIVRSFPAPEDRSAYIASLPANRRLEMAGLDLRAIVAVPLRGGNRRLGVLVLSRSGEAAEPFEPGDVGFAQAMAGRALLALERLAERQHVEDELRRMAFVDELTGLANRRASEQAIASRIGSLGRHGWAFGLLVVDVDHLKEINDRHGHAAGDAALRLVAQTLAQGSRSEDLVGRWGGDEFVVLVSGATPSLLAQASQRIATLVAHARLAGADDPIELSISVGAAVAWSGDTVELVFARADKALYEAKAGRPS